MNLISDEKITESISEVENGKHAQKDLFLCAKPNLLDVESLAKHRTVVDVSAYIDEIVRATSECDLRAWQTGVCNTTIPNQIRHPNKTGFLLESIATEAVRRSKHEWLKLEVIWCSPYQIATESSQSIVTVEGLSLKLHRNDYLVRIDVSSLRRYPSFFESSITGSFLRQFYVLAVAETEKLQFDIFCSVVLIVNLYLLPAERKLIMEPILSGNFESEMNHILSLPGKNFVAALISYCKGTSHCEMLAAAEKKYKGMVDTILKINYEDKNELQKCFLKLLASMLSNNVVQPKDLSRDAIGFLLLAADEGLLDGCSADVLDSLDEIAFDECTEYSEEDLHRSSQDCLFRGRRRGPFGSHRWLDNNRATYSIEPSLNPSVTSTCAGKVVRLGIENGVPWMYGLDLKTLLSVLMWGMERAPVINGNPSHDMVLQRKVRGQTVVSLLFSGKIGDRGTAWLMSQIMHGDLKLSPRSRNGFVAAIAKYKSTSDTDGYRFDALASPIMISRLNMVVLDSDPYLVLGEYEVAKIYRRNGYLRVSRIGTPHGRVDAIGRAYVGRPVK